MSIEKKLLEKPQRLSLLDIALVKWVYILVGLLVAKSHVKSLSIGFAF